MQNFQPYIVQPGDTLWGIAKRQTGSGQNWHDLYARNKSVVGSNPNLIFPGQRLNFGTPQAQPPALQPMGPSRMDTPVQPMQPGILPAFGDDAPGRIAFDDAGFAPPMVPKMDFGNGMSGLPPVSPPPQTPIPNPALPTPYGGGVADNTTRPQLPVPTAQPQIPADNKGYADKRLPQEVYSLLADAQRQVDERDAAMRGELDRLGKEIKRRNNAVAFGMLFGGKPAMANTLPALQQSYNALVTQAMEESRRGQEYMRKMYAMYDSGTIDAQYRLGQLDIGRRNATTNEGRLADSQARTGIQRGQLDRQTAADEYRQKHDGQLLQQRQAENIARQNDNAQRDMAAAMRFQQRQAEHRADRASKENIAAATRAQALKLFQLRGQGKDSQTQVKATQQADKVRRQRLTKLEGTLNKPPKGLNLASIYDGIANEFTAEEVQAVANQLKANVQFRNAATADRHNMFARALLSSALTTRR